MKMYPVKAVLFCLLITVLCARAETVTDTETGELPVDEIRAFAEVFAKIKKDYVENVEDSVLLEHAIRGMLEGLDPHSSYLDEEAYLDLQEGTSGNSAAWASRWEWETGSSRSSRPSTTPRRKKQGCSPAT